MLKRRQAGSVPTGPSPQYERLIRGEIKPKDYTSSVRKRVDQQRRSDKGMAKRDDGEPS